VELHRPGAGSQLHLVVSPVVFVRERRVGGPGLQGEPIGWAVCCRPGALTGRSEGSVSSPGHTGCGAGWETRPASMQ
jgi:hypothetical protein